MPGHLIHIGFPKAGSTSLQAWFERHPELVFARERFGGYRSIWDLPASTAEAGWSLRWHVSSAEPLAVPQPEDMLRLRRIRPLRDRRVRVCELLRLLAPEATILIVTRGFGDALAAMYSQSVRVGGSSTVAQAIERARSEIEPKDELVLNYDDVIALYEEAFGQDHVIVLPLELMRDDSPAFLAALSERLGLAQPPPELPHLNPSLSPAELYWYPRLSRAVELVARRLGRRGPSLVWFYRARIGGPDLRRVVRLLARIGPPDGWSPRRELPDWVVERHRGLASSLASRPFYDRYRADYLLD